VVGVDTVALGEEEVTDNRPRRGDVVLGEEIQERPPSAREASISSVVGSSRS
jgi:hypothetical protein